MKYLYLSAFNLRYGMLKSLCIKPEAIRYLAFSSVKVKVVPFSDTLFTLIV